MFGIQAKTFTIGNTEMPYVEFGRGKKPLFILPGLSDGIQSVEKSPYALAFFYRKYAKMYRIYVCSRKKPLDADSSTRDMANDLASFMKAHHMHHAHVLGVSMGGMIAQHLAAEHPELVEKLIIAVSSSKPNATSHRVLSDWMSMVKEGRYGDFIVDTMKKTYTNRYLRKYRPFYFFLRRMGKPQSTQHFMAQACACLEHNAHDQLYFINCPTLVVGGEKDQIVGGEASRLIAREIPDSKLLMYPQLGHGAFHEGKQFEKDSISFLFGSRRK